ncbi:hypothetical protein JCM10207_003734 [Rhodosporidiobolus poonsookiae]
MTKTEQHDLTVEGDKVIERSASGTLIAEKNYENVVQGFERAAQRKSTSHEKAAEDAHIAHSLHAAHDAEDSELHIHVQRPHHPHYAPVPGETHEDEVHRHRQIGALRANLHRDDRSDETKEHMREKLQELGGELEEDD